MPSPTISTSPGSPRRTAPPRQGPSIIFAGSTGALPLAVAGEEGAVNGDRRAVDAARHQRHHCRPDAARGMLQAGVEAQSRRSRQGRAHASGDRSRPAFPRPRAMPARCERRLGALQGVGVGFSASRCLALAGESPEASARSSATGRAPEARRSRRADRSRHGSARAPCRPLRRRSRGSACDRHAPGSAPSSCARAAPAEGLGDGFSGHGAPRRRSAWRARRCRWPRELSARDHSARTAKKPVTFSVICRASSRLRSRPMRGCQTWRVRSIRLSFAACDGFTEDLTGGSSPLRAPGLRPRNSHR